jgi:oligopeptide transport system permease protein
MNAYILRRLLLAPLVLLVLATVAFALARAVPGGPYDEERALPPAVRAAQMARAGLDRPLPEQWLRTIASLATGSLPSLKSEGLTVAEVVRGKLPTSLFLGATALAVALVAGLGAALAGAHRSGLVDRGLAAGTMAAVAIPTFVIGPVLALALGLWLGWLPVAGWGGFQHLLLPAATLAIPVAARIARLARGALAETAHADHVRTARAKGLGDGLVLWRHRLRLALVPVLAFLGPAAAYLLTGSVVVEQVFQVPGLGTEFIQSALNRDHNLVMGLTVLYGALLIACNLAADLAVAVADPRVRLA